MPSTAEIVAAQGGIPDYARMDRENVPISTTSRWRSPIWKLDTGRRASPSKWINLSLVPTGFEQVARVAIWSALADSRGETPLTIASVAGKMHKVDQVLAWVARCNCTLAEVDAELFECFLDDLDEAAEGGLLNGRDGQPSTGVVLRTLDPWSVLRDQASAMREAAVDALTFDPFAEKAPGTIAKEIADSDTNRTEALPDEISAPLVEAAARMADEPTAAAARALRNYVSTRIAYEGTGKVARMLPPLETGNGDVEDADGDPALDVEGADMPAWRGTAGSVRAYEASVMRLVRKVVGAHIMMVYACGGMRAGEFLAADAGTDSLTGLPTCVEREPSASELFDHYWLKGVREKLTDDEPEHDEWLIGCAVAGDTEPPEAVRAVMGIQEILAPLRDLGDEAGRRALLVSPGNGFMTVKPGALRPMSYWLMRDWMHAFIREGIDWSTLPDFAIDGTDMRPHKLSEGRTVTPRAWRKTLVQFMLRIDGRMTLPLARRLRHKVHTVVNQAYQSSDPSLLEEVDDAMARTLARTLVGVAKDGRRIGGWLGERMTAHIDEVRALTTGIDGQEAVAVVQAWARERNLGLLEAGPGKCGLRLMPRHALCHQVAGTAGWWQTEPHPGRCDEHCANCKCCVSDSDHLHFWTRRYVDTQRQVLISRRIGREGEAWAHAAQAAIARTMLTRLEGRIPPDEEIH